MTNLDVWGNPEPPPPPPESPELYNEGEEIPGRHLVVTRASQIQPKKVSWLWTHRIAAGTLALLAGREGLGKSTLTAWIVAMVTRGELPGHPAGGPRSVIIAATEDSWEHTIIPRLMAAEADLDKVLRVEAETGKGYTEGLNLPKDIREVAQVAKNENVGLIVLDPIMSRLESLDTHKDAAVRTALEPLVRMADENKVTILGLIHLNKTTSDPLNAVMGSKAFTAVARSVLTVVADPEDEEDRRRLLGVAKSNLGPIPPGSDVFTVEKAEFTTPDCSIETGTIRWCGTSSTTIKSAMADQGMEIQGAIGEAVEWLEDYLAMKPGTARMEVLQAARKAGHAEATVKRAATRLGVLSITQGYPRTATWSLSTRDSGTPSQLDQSQTFNSYDPTDPTDLTVRDQGKHLAQLDQTGQLDQLDQSDHVTET